MADDIHEDQAMQIGIRGNNRKKTPEPGHLAGGSGKQNLPPGFQGGPDLPEDVSNVGLDVFRPAEPVELVFGFHGNVLHMPVRLVERRAERDASPREGSPREQRKNASGRTAATERIVLRPHGQNPLRKPFPSGPKDGAGAFAQAAPHAPPRIDFRAEEPVRLMYLLVPSRGGRWDFEHAVRMPDREITGLVRGRLGPGEKHRTIRLNRASLGEDGRALLQIVSLRGEAGVPWAEAGRVIEFLPSGEENPAGE